MTKNLILVPCTARKELLFFEVKEWSPSGSVFEHLDEEHGSKLFQHRRTVAETVMDRGGYFHSSSPGRDLGYDVDDPMVSYLPAYLRYSRGRAYRRFGEYFWKRIEENSDKIDVLFLSPLYGVARFTELIRYYNIDIEDTGRDHRPVHTIWNDRLANIIVNYALNTNADQITVLTSYRYLKYMLGGLREQCLIEGIRYYYPVLSYGLRVLDEIGWMLERTVNEVLGSIE